MSGDENRAADAEGERRLLVDASVVITLAEIDALSLIEGMVGDVVVPEAVVEEVTADPAATILVDAIEDGWIGVERAEEVAADRLPDAASYLGSEAAPGECRGDVSLLAIAMATENAVLVSDDKPLRKTFNALSIPLSGSIGVLIRAVERGDVNTETAKSTLLAMDEVGARLSASLFRRAERLIDEVADS